MGQVSNLPLLRDRTVEPPSETLFPTPGSKGPAPLVTDIKPTGRDAKYWSILAGPKRLARVCRATLESCSLRPGLTWTNELAARVARAELVAKHTGLTIKRLIKRQHSAAEIQDRLIADGLTPQEATSILRHLSDIGLIDDRRMADSLVRSQTSRGPVAPRLLLHRLSLEKVQEDAAQSAVASGMSGRSETDDAAAVAAQRITTLPRTLPDAAVVRRLLNYLARRGYEPETAESAVQSAMRGAGRNAEPISREDPGPDSGGVT